MAKQLKSEIEVLDKIGAKDFRSINKEQIIEFASSIHQMPKEVAIKCIEQFPEFRKNSNEVLTTLRGIFNDAANSHKDLAAQQIDACNKIIEELSKELHRPFISSKKRSEISNQIVEVAHMIDAARQGHENLVKKIVNRAAAVAGVIAVAAAAVVGVNIRKG